MTRTATGTARRPCYSERSRPVRCGGPLAGALVAVALVLAACGTTTTSAAAAHASGKPRILAASTTGCRTTVGGVVSGPGSLAAGWLPAGFHLTSGTTSDPASGLTYSTAGPDPARIELKLSNSPGALTTAAGGRTTASAVEVQGRPGLIETGPPDPRFVGVYWKPTASDLLSIVGYKLAAATVLDVARQVTFGAPGVISLPVRPGTIVTRASAVAAARRAANLSQESSAQAKLSSWTEISSLLLADQAGTGINVPPAVAAAPWRPVWAVLFAASSASSGSSHSSTPSARAELVVVSAPSGQPLITVAIAHRAWFAALTDRDPSLGGCPGGSTARLPFGVLTRAEETYVADASPGPPTRGAARSVIVTLTTVPALNSADPGLYGGCVQQNCSLPELVWPTIVVVHAAAGTTLACLPPWASYPPGYQPKQVHQYVTISVAGNAAIVCGPAPNWVNQLADLAPAASW